MSRSQNTPLLLALVVCIMLVGGVMVAAVFVAHQKPVVVILPGNTSNGAMAAAEPEIPAAPSAAIKPAAKAPELAIMRVAVVPALDNVFDVAWDKIPPADIPLQAQQTTTPMLDTATVASIQVQAIRDDKRLAWRLSWLSARPSTLSETNRFGDAVAMQFPMVDGAPFTMGAKGQPVRLLHWKAIWQKDIDEGFQDVAKIYPNAWSDLNWFAPQPGLAAATQLARDPKSEQYMIAHAAGNPMANVERKQPCEEIAAEGFGSATTVPDSHSSARGVWKDGRWTVVIDRPLDSSDPLVARLQSAGPSLISFAVWDGAAGNRGSRKHYCVWVPLKVEP